MSPPFDVLWTLGFTAGFAALGAVTGAVLRRATPHVLSMRNPQVPFSVPWMEGVGAFLFGFWSWRLGGDPAALAAVLLLSTYLLAVVATDYFAKLIPDRLTFSGVAVGSVFHSLMPAPILGVSALHPFLAERLGLSVDGAAAGMFLALAGALLGFLALEAIRGAFGLAVGMQVMGMGDSKLLMLIGAFLGPVGVASTLVLSFLVGVVHGLIYLKVSGQPHSPFGPPLAIAALSVLAFSGGLIRLLSWFQSWVLALPVTVLALVYSVLLSIAVFLLWRTRGRALEYEEAIEEDYRHIEQRLDAE